jgi:hypothetical protein
MTCLLRRVEWPPAALAAMILMHGGCLGLMAWATLG